MNVLLPDSIGQTLVVALQKAGNREIGGILMGEHVSDATYRVKDITIQRHGGKFASFTRVVRGSLMSLRRFFRKTEYDFTRFNYLGEWHSHPLFGL